MPKKTKQITYQIIAPASPARKSNGIAKGQVKLVVADRTSRSFEDRFVPRYDEIPPIPEDLPEQSFSEPSIKILKERYLLKGGDLKVAETVTERFWHLAYDIASGDFDFGYSKKQVLDNAKEFYTMMVHQQFLPNSPTIMNAGKQNGLQYSACFVLPVADSIPEIFDTMKYAALIHQTGGGTGFSFSRLRPNGSRVKRSGGVASGPVSFLRVYDAATQSIKQGGTRRGANMGILRIDHPDVLEFIRCKAELDDQNQPVYDSIAPFLPDDMVRKLFKTKLLDTQISNFNISCAVTDRFMDAYYKGEDYELTDPSTGEVSGTLNAKEVMDEIVERAWSTGDPGLVFIDRINNSTANPVPELETIESTNPCGEQPLAPWDACNLGSINLGKFVKEDKSIDWEGLRECVRKSVHFLDNVVQTNPFSIREIYDEVHNNRRIGLGVMGWADMLFRMKIAYDSSEAIELAEEVMKFINEEGHHKSEELAAEKGPFPNWSHSIYKTGKPLRNSTVTTIAPTGTISIIGDCASGIEPVFALAYLHKAKGDGGKTGNEIRTLTIANMTFTEIAKREGFYSDDLAQKVMDQGSVMGVAEVPAEWQRVFVTAPEIDPIQHVKMQAAFQRYTDNGVSKTINMPNSVTAEDVREAYLLAWETGCNGITIYRDGSKSVQVLNVSSSLKPKGEETGTEVLVPEGDPREGRPMVLRGRTYEIMTPVGKAFVTINRDAKDLPFEVFITVGRGGMHTMADAEAIGRLTSIALRVAKNNRREIAEKIVQQLRGIGGSSQIGFGKDRVMSLADAIAKILSEDLSYVSTVEEASAEPLMLELEASKGDAMDDVVAPSRASDKLVADLCPSCGDAAFVMEEGCKKCHSCGYSLC